MRATWLGVLVALLIAPAANARDAVFIGGGAATGAVLSDDVATAALLAGERDGRVRFHVVAGLLEEEGIFYYLKAQLSSAPCGTSGGQRLTLFAGRVKAPGTNRTGAVGGSLDGMTTFRLLSGGRELTCTGMFGLAGQTVSELAPVGAGGASGLVFARRRAGGSVSTRGVMLPTAAYDRVSSTYLDGDGTKVASFACLPEVGDEVLVTFLLSGGAAERMSAARTVRVRGDGALIARGRAISYP